MFRVFDNIWLPAVARQIRPIEGAGAIKHLSKAIWPRGYTDAINTLATWAKCSL